ncbi:hypothetical protein [Vibrio cholerae]|nr:hypothetical protein [Vibrio cholerae]
MASEAAQKLNSTNSFTCLALVKPISKLAKQWGLTKPSYCIFDYSKATGTVEIRWGDGSGQQIETANELDDLILLQQFDDNQIAVLFD